MPPAQARLRRRRVKRSAHRRGGRATSPARSTSSRRLRASGIDEVPFTYPLRREMFGSLTRNQRFQRRVEDVSVRVRLLGGLHALTRRAGSRPGGAAPAGAHQRELAVLRTSLLPSLVAAARRNVELGTGTDRSLRARARLPAVGRPLPDRRWHPVAASRRAASPSPRASWRALRRARDFEAPFRAAPHELFHRVAVRGARTGAGWVGDAARPRAAWRVSGAASSSTSTRSRLRAREPVQLRRRHHVSPRAPGSRVRRRRRRAGCRPPRGREGGGRRGAPGDARLPDVYRGRRSRLGNKSIAFSVTFQSARADPDRRGRCTSSEVASFRRSKAPSAPSSGPRSRQEAPRRRAAASRPSCLQMSGQTSRHS